MSFEKSPDPYYKNLFIKKFRTPEEAEEMKSNTDEFSMWLIANPDKFSPIFKWFINFYFNGLDEDSKVVAFDDDIVRCAKAGITKPLLIDTTAQGSTESYSIFGMICLAFNEPYDFDDIEKEYVDDLLEEIRIKSELFTFKQCDWDYFREQHWHTVCADILNDLIKDFNVLKESFLVKEITRVAEEIGVGVPFEYIEKDDNYNPPHSGYGFDFSKYYPKNTTILKLSECTHPANSCGSD